jgi:hypothetical protein
MWDSFEAAQCASVLQPIFATDDVPQVGSAKSRDGRQADEVDVLVQVSRWQRLYS